MTSPVGSAGNISAPPNYLSALAASSADYDFHLQQNSLLVDVGGGTDSDGGPSDIGIYGGTAQWDLDGDGYYEWWQPGAYDSTAYPAQGWDCDDTDANITPLSGC